MLLYKCFVFTGINAVFLLVYPNRDRLKARSGSANKCTSSRYLSSEAILYTKNTGPIISETETRCSCPSPQQTQNNCRTFVHCWINVEDVGPMLYKCYTNDLCLLGRSLQDHHTTKLIYVGSILSQRHIRCTNINPS